MILKDVVGYEGLYQVSDTGQIYSLISNKYLKQRHYKNGYMHIDLHKNKESKTFLVHRLVAIAFLENPNNLPQVNHIDGDKTNNNLNNLEWCDQYYNMKHASEHGLLKSTKGQKLSEETKKKMSLSRKGHKAYYYKRVAQIDPNTDKIIKIFNSTHDAAKELKCHHTSISEVCRHKKNRKITKGYKWEYLDNLNNK